MFTELLSKWAPSRCLLRETKKDPETADLDRIQKLVLCKGADVNYSKKWIGFTPLGNACRTGNNEAVDWLLRQGAKSNIARYYEFGREPDTPLRVASQEGHIETVRLLLEKNVTSGLCNALVDACSIGHVEIALLLLEHAVKSDINPTFQTAPLYPACGNGHVKIVQALIQKGAHVDRKDYKSGSSSLCVASANGHLAVVELLLENGANMTFTDSSGCTPLRISNYRGHKKVSEALQKEEIRRSTKSYSHLVCSNLHSVATQELLNEVGRREHPDCQQVKRIQSLILEQKADLNCKATNGCTPLYWVCSEGHFEIAKLLLGNGANPNIANTGRDWERGDTPLFASCRKGHLQIARLLLEHKAFVDNCTLMGRDESALHWACSHGKIEMVKLLLRHGAEVNRQVYGNKGDSPLFVAIKEGYLEIVKILLKNGAEQSITHEGAYFNDMQEKMPDMSDRALDVAIRNGHTDIVRVLRQAPEEEKEEEG